MVQNETRRTYRLHFITWRFDIKTSARFGHCFR